MKTEKINVGDVVAFKIGDGNTILHARVNAKGRKFLMPNMPFARDVLFITVFEHPEWKDVSIQPNQVIAIIILPEKVQFN